MDMLIVFGFLVSYYGIRLLDKYIGERSSLLVETETGDATCQDRVKRARIWLSRFFVPIILPMCEPGGAI
ncbi:MAG: hypothetical protein PUD64_10045 [Bacteroidales bacterium]|nr:hypothetical protein [Bacteroidales bacterium]